MKDDHHPTPGHTYVRPTPLTSLKKRWAEIHKNLEHRKWLRGELQRLRTEPIDSASGKAIEGLMEQSAKAEYVDYARQWLDKFPDDPAVPKLVGVWLAQYKSNEAIEYARNLLRTAGDTWSLGHLIERCVTDSRVFKELEEDLSARMERDPSDPGWYNLQGVYGSVEEADALSLRWLSSNVSNPKVVHFVQFMACFTKSDAVREAIADWAMESVGTDYLDVVIYSLLDGYDKLNETTRQKVVTVAQKWVNSDTTSGKTITYGVATIKSKIP